MAPEDMLKPLYSPVGNILLPCHAFRSQTGAHTHKGVDCNLSRYDACIIINVEVYVDDIRNRDFRIPRASSPGEPMKDLKAHKKDYFPHRDRAGRQNKRFPDIETLMKALVASVTSA